MANLKNNQVPIYSESIFTPASASWPLSILVRKSKNFDADMKLIKEKFGEIRSKKVGKFTKLFPDNLDGYRDLISFLSSYNFRYLTPKWIKTFIKGLPCDLKTQKIKEALTEKGLYVQKVEQLVDSRTGRALPLFQVILLNSDRNKNIFYMTDLMNFNISVGRFETVNYAEPPFYPVMIKLGIRETIISEAGFSNSINFGESTQVASSDSCENTSEVNKTFPIKQKTEEVNMAESESSLNQTKYQELTRKISEVSQNIVVKKEITDVNMDQVKFPRNQKKHQEFPLTNSSRESKSSTDILDINHVMKEFRELLEKIDELKAYARQIRKDKNSEI